VCTCVFFHSSTLFLFCLSESLMRFNRNKSQDQGRSECSFIQFPCPPSPSLSLYNISFHATMPLLPSSFKELGLRSSVSDYNGISSAPLTIYILYIYTDIYYIDRGNILCMKGQEQTSVSER